MKLTTTGPISASAAELIADALNASLGMGGKRAFDADGTGGEWYSEDVYGLDAAIVAWCPNAPIAAEDVVTAGDEWLERCAEDAAEEKVR